MLLHDYSWAISKTFLNGLNLSLKVNFLTDPHPLEEMLIRTSCFGQCNEHYYMYGSHTGDCISAIF
jgi:hypothetical protein